MQVEHFVGWKQHEAEHVVVLLDLVEVVDPVYVAPLVVGKMVDFVEQDVYMHVFVVVVVELGMRVVTVISLQYLVLLHVEVGTVVLVDSVDVDVSEVQGWEAYLSEIE